MALYHSDAHCPSKRVSAVRDLESEVNDAQVDPLLGLLTAVEHLRLYCRLKVRPSEESPPPWGSSRQTSAHLLHCDSKTMRVP